MEEINKKGISKKSLQTKLTKIFINNDKSNSIVLVGHNIDFDFGCLCNFINDEQFTKLFKKHKKICTMKSTTNFCKLSYPNSNNSLNKNSIKKYKWPKLSELANKLEIKIDEDKFHDSKYDVEITKQCFVKLKDKYIKKLG